MVNQESESFNFVLMEESEERNLDNKESPMEISEEQNLNNEKRINEENYNYYENDEFQSESKNDEFQSKSENDESNDIGKF